MALQWLAYVYPSSEQHLRDTLQRSLSYTDDTLVERWRQLLENQSIEQHVEALRWLSSTLSRDQVPFLVETCWRLLLVHHEMPSQVPLALRLMSRILNVSESRVLEIGERVQREIHGDGDDVERSPLLPEDPRYLDRVEWRLFGVHARTRRSPAPKGKRNTRWVPYTLVFLMGFVFGGSAISYLVWGPPQWGRHPVPRMSHLIMDPAETTSSAPAAVETAPESEAPETAASSSAELAAPAVAQTAPVTPAEPEPEPEPAPVAQAQPQTPAPQPAATPAPASSGVQPNDGPAISSTGSEEVLMAVTASVLNVRAEPSTSSPVIMKLGEGARVWVDPEQTVGGFWARVRVSGEIGYASRQFLRPAN